MSTFHTRLPQLPAGTAVITGLITAAFTSVLPASANAGGIVPDGASATGVSMTAEGRQAVRIAPAVSGVSHNSYSAFNVGRAGAEFINAGINARNIVNQVSGTDPSLIEGPITVTGPRANVLLANPNGITVNGASFINTGKVALTTGQVRLRDVEVAPGQMQRNILLTTGSGKIEIGPEGLSGAMLNLELIARQVRVNGPAVNGFANAAAGIRIVAGHSSAEIDGSVSPTDNLTPWISYASPNADGGGATALDITALGSLTGGRIELIVTDKGAAVRHAGTAYANAGDFSLNASGQLSVAGGRISALHDVIIASNGVTLRSEGSARAAIVAENGGVQIDSAADISNRGGLIQGMVGLAGNPASGAVTLNAAGNVSNESPSAIELGAIFGSGDDVAIHAGGKVSNRRGRILSNASLRIDAGGDVENIVDKEAGANDGQARISQTEAARWLVLKKRSTEYDVDYGKLAMPDQLAYLVAAGGMSVRARGFINRGGEIQVNGGSLDIVVADRFENAALFAGSAHFRRDCLVFCGTSASSTVQSHGGLVSAGSDIRIRAGSTATNIGGRVLALGNLSVSAPTVTARGVLGYTAYQRDGGFKTWFGDSWARLYAMDVGGTWTAHGGRLVLDGEGVLDGGCFCAVGEVEASGGIRILRQPRRDPVAIESHLGLTSWLWK